ncbi:DUF4328 domain-containing protein [Streptomyces sp. NPDC002187]|uniref:DUF4328 domain-containing protein n=1 Tax=Streptomyces sp. NPDC002187 TaxID=3364637 RepID=UPI0036C26340
MLCSRCGTHAAATGDGLCDGCAAAARRRAEPLAAPAVPGRRWLPALRSPVGLGRAVVALLGLVIVSDLAAIAASLNVRRVVNGFTGGGSAAYAIDEADQADLWMAIASGFGAVAVLATAVVFLVWFSRVRANAGVFAPDLMTRNSGWAIGGWFVPLANLWIPRSVAADVWKASRQDPYRGNEGLVSLWWTGFLATWFFDRAAERQYDKADSGSEIGTAADFLAISCLVDIGAAVLAILFVHKLTQMQHAKALRGPEPVAV